MVRYRAIEICKNLKKTINRIETAVIGNSILKNNNIWSPTRASKSKLKRKLDNLLEKYNINENDV